MGNDTMVMKVFWTLKFVFNDIETGYKDLLEWAKDIIGNKDSKTTNRQLNVSTKCHPHIR